MTLQELFDTIGNNPSWIMIYFCLIPITALIAGFMGKGEGNLTPWKELYSVLIYLVCIPGIFAITLSIYFFLFERRGILDTDVYSQIIPVVSMIATLFLIRNNASLDRIPGFGKVSGLMMVIFASLALMWGLDRTRIYVVAFTRMPFYYVLLIFAGIFFMVRFGFRRMLG